MDCFDSHYYSLNRNLLLFIGQWPYQNRSERVKKWLLYFCIIILIVVTQVGRAMYTDIDFDLCVEFIAETMVCVIMIIKYYSYTVNSDKIKGLLDSMRLNMQSLIGPDEHAIFGESSEEGRLHVVRYAMFMCPTVMLLEVILLTSPLLVYTPLTNESCPVLMIYIPNFYVDPQKYCYPMVIYIGIIWAALIGGIFAVDSMYMIIMYHAVAMFRVVCYRLKHAFDDCTKIAKYPSGRSTVRENIASAVECHRTAISFSDDMITAYEWPNLMSLGLALVSIAVALYWGATSQGEFFKVLFAMGLCVGQMIHIFVIGIPSQKMIDHSEAVIFKAYSSLWYMGRVKEQTLLLLTMQRGLKPCAMIIGKTYPVTLENFATEVKASFSYFTVLMSVK